MVKIPARFIYSVTFRKNPVKINFSPIWFSGTLILPKKRIADNIFIALFIKHRYKMSESFVLNIHNNTCNRRVRNRIFFRISCYDKFSF